MLEGENVFIYRVLEDNSLEKIQIQIGNGDEGFIEVISGLNEGDVIDTVFTFKNCHCGPKMRQNGGKNMIFASSNCVRKIPLIFTSCLEFITRPI